MLQMHRPVWKVSGKMVGDLTKHAYDQDVSVSIVE